MSTKDTIRKMVFTQIEDLRSRVSDFRAMKRHSDPANEFGECSEILFDLKWVITDYNRILEHDLGIFTDTEMEMIRDTIFDSAKIVKNYLATVKTVDDITKGEKK